MTKEQWERFGLGFLALVGYYLLVALLVSHYGI